jgi:hypothetical protein
MASILMSHSACVKSVPGRLRWALTYRESCVTVPAIFCLPFSEGKQNTVLHTCKAHSLLEVRGLFLLYGAAVGGRGVGGTSQKVVERGGDR